MLSRSLNGAALSCRFGRLCPPVVCAVLLNCYLDALISNLGYNDGAGLYGEGCCAVNGCGGTESLAVKSIEADHLVVVEAGDGDEAAGGLDGDATHGDVVDCVACDD